MTCPCIRPCWLIYTGYVLAGSKLLNIYKEQDEASGPLFSAEDYKWVLALVMRGPSARALPSHDQSTNQPSSFYHDVIERIKRTIDAEFGVDVFFTSPTFITRIVGSRDWRPQSMHDEYWCVRAGLFGCLFVLCVCLGEGRTERQRLGPRRGAGAPSKEVVYTHVAHPFINIHQAPSRRQEQHGTLRLLWPAVPERARQRL